MKLGIQHQCKTAVDAFAFMLAAARVDHPALNEGIGVEARIRI